MDRKRVYHSIEWIITILACGYLGYRLAVYEDYASLWVALRAMNGTHVCALLLCVALMPVNMGMEAWKWMTLWNYELRIKNFELKITNYKLISFREAQRQVYYGKAAGLITPWRVGEYPARGMRMTNGEGLTVSGERIWGRVLSMGVVSGATMTAVIIACGVMEFMISNLRFRIYDFGGSYLVTVVLALLLLAVGLYFAPRLLRRWATVSRRLVMVSLGQSAIRYICWCVQLALVLYALGAVTGDGLPVTGLRYDVMTLLRQCVIYYLVITVTPNVPIAEVGVRGAWAIWVFGSANAALAAVILWVVNTVLPCLVWPVMSTLKKINIDKHR